VSFLRYFFHLRRLRQVRHRVGKDITICLVLAVIMSRLDYCNSVLFYITLHYTLSDSGTVAVPGRGQGGRGPLTCCPASPSFSTNYLL